MAYLARLTQLTELHCTNEELTDEGIHHLSSLTDLNTLALRDCCEVSGDALLVSVADVTAVAGNGLCDARGSGCRGVFGILGLVHGSVLCTLGQLQH
jgi:hypothetical protein